VAKVGTSKAGGTISQLGCGTAAACRGRPLKKKKATRDFVGYHSSISEETNIGL
jgi:hypothetical protein